MKWRLHYTLFLILISLSHLNIQSQNLVPNPGFENLKAFPPCWLSGSRDDFPAYAEEWIIPNMGTTDLLSQQAPSYCITSMPFNTAPVNDYFPKGSQIPHTGNNFAGIKPLYDSRREYLEVKLACPLIPGEEYYAEMYVSLSENTNYAQNSLGMYFSDTLVYTNTFDMLNFTPQVVENNVISDTVNWVKISGTFIAASPAEFLIIGSFATQANTTLQFLGNKGNIDFPYYFIDDITVRRVNPPNATITGDTVVCKGDTVHLNISGWPSVKWLIPSAQSVVSNTNDLIFIPSQGGIITAQTKYCNLNLRKEVNIVIAPGPVINIGNDTMICPGTSLTLDAGPGLDRYKWNTGLSSQTITVSSPGVYWVTADNSMGCQGKDAIKIAYYKVPAINLGDDQLTCKPEGILDVYTGQAYDSYIWQDNSTSPRLIYSSEGVYWVTITNQCGEEDSDTLTITKIDPFVPNLITPNGDDKNERFEILDIENDKGKLWIYNRYGALVYEDKSYRNDFSGTALIEGVYYYLFEYPSCPELKGWLHIIK